VQLVSIYPISLHGEVLRNRDKFISFVRVWVFTAAKIQVEVFWVVTQCGAVLGY
jgi:hypothetical protein